MKPPRAKPIPAAICGNCGKPFGSHQTHHHYCFSHTNGDLFTDEPGHRTIVYILEAEHAELYNSIIQRCKELNGHEASED